MGQTHRRLYRVIYVIVNLLQSTNEIDTLKGISSKSSARFVRVNLLVIVRMNFIHRPENAKEQRWKRSCFAVVYAMKKYSIPWTHWTSICGANINVPSAVIVSNANNAIEHLVRWNIYGSIFANYMTWPHRSIAQHVAKNSIAKPISSNTNWSMMANIWQIAKHVASPIELHPHWSYMNGHILVKNRTRAIYVKRHTLTIRTWRDINDQLTVYLEHRIRVQCANEYFMNRNCYEIIQPKHTKR